MALQGPNHPTVYLLAAAGAADSVYWANLATPMALLRRVDSLEGICSGERVSFP